MYRITVNTPGKYYNVSVGTRYCLTRKTAIRLANLYFGSDCDITIEKFVRCGSMFCWSDLIICTKIVVEADEEDNITARKANKNDW